MKAQIGDRIKIAMDCQPVEIVVVESIEICADGTQEYKCGPYLIHEDELDMDDQVVLMK